MRSEVFLLASGTCDLQLKNFGSQSTEQISGNMTAQLNSL